MDITTAVELVKERLGIRSTVRDTYLTAIVEGVIQELTDEKGVTLVEGNASHLMFVCDYATWRYQSRDSAGAIPRHLQFRMHNLIIHSGGAGS